MGEPLWDAATVLRITSLNERDDAKIWCVGQTTRNTRCSSGIHGHDRSSIRPLLRLISCQQPNTITQEKLRYLASLCLCRTYHYNQIEDVARAWFNTVKIATGGYIPQSPSIGDRLESLQKLRNARRLYLTYEAKAAEATEALMKHKRQSEAEEERLRSEITYWKNQIDAKSNDQENAISKLEMRNCALIEENKQSLVATERANMKADYFQRSLEEMTILAQCSQSKADQSDIECERLMKENEILRNEISKLMGQLDQLRKNKKASKEAATRLVEAHAAQKRQLKICLAELKDEQSHNSVLAMRNAHLEITMATLTRSISHCWVHRFGSWTFGSWTFDFWRIFNQISWPIFGI